MQAVVIHLKKVPEIQRIRKKYDPKLFLKPHITICYPFKVKNAENIIKETLKNTKPFEIRLDRPSRSTQEHYLLLRPSKGESKLNNLRKLLYKKLKIKWNMPFSYRPHVTLGRLKDRKHQTEALEYSKGIDIRYKVDTISYIEVTKDHKLLYEKRIRL